MNVFLCTCNAILIKSCYTEEYKVIQKESPIIAGEAKQYVPEVNSLIPFMPKKATTIR